jgi:multicomponent Na+:H+ antiporter subunit E
MHFVKWAVLLALFWLLLSGIYQPLIVAFGVVSVLLVIYVLKRMDETDSEPKPVASGARICRYFIWLTGEIVASSIHVTKLVWGNPRNLSPSLAKVSVAQVPDKVRVLYANSITLTPGTLSVDIENDEITVHALQSKSIDELKQGEMENKITSIWGKKGA